MIEQLLGCQVARLPPIENRVGDNATLVGSDDVPFAALAEREGVSPSYFTRLVRLSYLAPDRKRRLITAHTLSGRQAAPCEWLGSREIVVSGKRINRVIPLTAECRVGQVAPRHRAISGHPTMSRVRSQLTVAGS